MTPIEFPEANAHFAAPPQYAETQVKPIRAYCGSVAGGSMDGTPVVVTAWKPNDEEVAAMNGGAPIFLTFIGNALPPHMASVNFAVACHPA